MKAAKWLFDNNGKFDKDAENTMPYFENSHIVYVYSI